MRKNNFPDDFWMFSDVHYNDFGLQITWFSISIISNFNFFTKFHHNLNENVSFTLRKWFSSSPFFSIFTIYLIYLVIMKNIGSIFPWIKGVPLYEKSTFPHNLNKTMSIPSRFSFLKNRLFWTHFLVEILWFFLKCFFQWNRFFSHGFQKHSENFVLLGHILINILSLLFVEINSKNQK